MLYLETERLMLRDYAPADEDAYIRLKSDPDTMYYLQDIQIHSPAEGRTDFQNVLEDLSSADRRFYFFRMELKSTHEQIGSIGYTVTQNTPIGKLAGVGYFTFPKFWNNGYTTEALKKIIAFAFEQNNVYRLTTGCLKENTASEKVMQKCGFIKEAEHINYEWHDNQIKTRLEYRLLKSEWPGNI